MPTTFAIHAPIEAEALRQSLDDVSDGGVVTEFHIHDIEFDHAHAILLSRAVGRCSGLLTLVMCNLVLQPQDLALVVYAATQSATLKRLFVRDIDMSPACVGMLGALLRESNTLEVLAASRCGLRDADARHLALALTQNRHLQHLGLSNNRIGIEGAKAIVTAAAGHPRMRRVTLQLILASKAWAQGVSAFLRERGVRLAVVISDYPSSDIA